MGVLSGLIFAALISFMIVFIGFFNLENVKNHRAAISHERGDDNISVVNAALPSGKDYDIENIERALIRTCQFKQALVLRCQNCLLHNPPALGMSSVCRLPTVSFCMGARNINIHNTKEMWSFLPANEGRVSNLFLLPRRNPENLTSASDLDRAAIYELTGALDSRYRSDGSLVYVRPSMDRNISDPCSVEGIVNKQP